MFSSTITRPLLWAIPLAVLGGIAAAVYFLRPLTVDVGGISVPCYDIGVIDSSFNPCAGALRRRLIGTGVVLLVGLLPLALVVLRACVMSADMLVAVRDEMRRLHERLDRLDSGR